MSRRIGDELTLMQRHMKAWSTDLATGVQKRDPDEDDADDVWQSLLIFGVNARDLAARFDVNPSTIYRIVTRQRWAHVA